MLALLELSAAPPFSAADAPPSGRQIRQWVEDRDDGDGAVSDLRMTLIDKRGDERVRVIRSLTKDFGETPAFDQIGKNDRLLLRIEYSF